MLIVSLFGKYLLRAGLQRPGVLRRCLCVAQSGCCPDGPEEADMIRSRGQIKRVLCVAEKNDAAKGISEIMSNGRSRRVSHVSNRSGHLCLNLLGDRLAGLFVLGQFHQVLYLKDE